jgi:Zn-dependent M28 family amino/carboxypeptidase
MDGRSVRLIVIIGVATFLFLMASSLFFENSMGINEDRRVSISKRAAPFDGRRSYADVEHVVGLGPRPAGSEASKQCRTYIKNALSEAGLRVEEQNFNARTPSGKRAMANIYGIVEGTQPGVIMLSNHYDTKLFTGFEFVGANDSGSTTGWMIEMARTLGPTREGRSVWLTFFDGEESVGEWTATDSLYGSRHFVQQLTEEDRISEIHTLINVDMIGDCLLGIHQDAGSPQWLRKLVWAKANELGYGKHFLAFGQGNIEDDHVPFRKANVPALNLIDFSYGGTMVEHRQNWHTPEDTIEKVCWGSLQVVGDVIYHVLPQLDAHLDAPGEAAP